MIDISNVRLDDGVLIMRVLFEDFLCGEEVMRYKNVRIEVASLPCVATFHVEGVIYDVLIEELDDERIMTISGGELEESIKVKLT